MGLSTRDGPGLAARWILVLVWLLGIIGAGAQGCNEFLEAGDFAVSRKTINLVQGNLQKIVDCVPSEGRIKIKPSLVAELNSTVHLDRPITLVSEAEAESRPVLKCINGSEPIFTVRSQAVIIRNVIIVHCTASTTNKYAIVVELPSPKGESERASLMREIVLENVDIVGNKTRHGSGAVHVKSANRVTFVKSLFQNNFAMNGGALLLDAPGVHVQIDACTFQENSAAGHGGAIFQNSSADVIIAESDFSGNIAMLSGGAYSMEENQRSSNLTIIRSVFENNTAVGGDVGPSGGALLVQGAPLRFHLISSRMSSNAALVAGGALVVKESVSSSSATVHINGTLLEGNTAQFGGAVFVASKMQNISVAVHNATFQRNEALSIPVGDSGRGGAMAVEGASAHMDVSESIFENNRASGICNSKGKGARGGALYVQDVINASMKDTTFRENSVIREDRLGEECSGGAVYFKAEKASMTVDMSSAVFTLNEAVVGGAVGIDGTVLLLANDGVAFSDNNASLHGGALFASGHAQIVGSSVIFSNNRAEEGGGAVALKGEENQLVLGSSVWSINLASHGSGGALLVVGENNVIAFENSTKFIGNIAHDDGGGVSLTSLSAFLVLDDVQFEGNHANRSGGALHAQALLGKSHVLLTDVTFVRNAALSVQNGPEASGLGGAMMLHGSGIRMNSHGSIKFQENKAREGGAVRIIDAPSANLTNALFESNSGLSGGAMHTTCTTDGKEGHVFIANSTFTGNTAYVGGALMADGKLAAEAVVLDDALTSALFDKDPGERLPQLVMEDVVIRGQVAAKGGGGMLLIDAFVKCSRCSIEGNMIDERSGGAAGGGVSLARSSVLEIDASSISGNSAGRGGGVSIFNSSMQATEVDFFNNVAGEEGGAVLVHSGRPALMVTGGAVRRNKAKVGAGIYATMVHGPGPRAHACEKVDDKDDIDGLRMVYMQVYSECRHSGNVHGNVNASQATPLSLVSLNDVKMRGNIAEAAGGAVFVDDPEVLCVCCGEACSESCPTRTSRTSTLPLGEVCASYWTWNAARMGFGQKIATGPIGTDMRSASGRHLTDNELLVGGHNSGEVLEALIVRFLDFSGNTVSNTGADAVVRVSSQTATLSGKLEQRVEDGIVTFGNVRANGKPGMHVLTITFSQAFPRIMDRSVQFEIRSCMRGEEAVQEEDGQNEFRCMKCPELSFSFIPSNRCAQCPEHAVCDGRSIVPIDGFWQAKSWLTEMQECLAPSACSYPGRQERLRNSSASSDRSLHYVENDALCEQGYRGVLCGSCKDGYGRMNGFKCQKCRSRSTTIIMMAAISGWGLVLYLFLVSNALSPGRLIKTVTVPVSVSTSGGEESEVSEVRIGVRVNPVTEAVKILVNFMQSTSIAMMIDNDWSREVRMLLGTEDYVSGAAMHDGLTALDCTLEKPYLIASVQRVCIALLLPVTIMVAMAIFWLLVMLLKRESKKYFCSRALTSVLVVVFLFYMEIAKRSLSMFHSIRANVPHPDKPDTSVTNRFWAEDTSMVFFQGTHKYLLSLMGIPYVALFCLGFPLVLFFILWRYTYSLPSEDFAQRYGFLFQAYGEEHVYWELTVFTRKLFLAAVMVFGHQWGANLQGVACLLILLMTLIFHLISQPYRQEVSRLNHLETMSLCASILTYGVGLALNDTNLTGWARITLSVFLITCSGLFVAFVLAHFIADGLEHLQIWIESMGVVFPPNVSSWIRSRIIVEAVWRASMLWFWNSVEQKLALPPVRRPIPREGDLAAARAARTNLPQQSLGSWS